MTVHVAAAAALGLLALLRLPTLVRRGDCVFFVAVFAAVASALDVAPIATAVDAAVGVRGMAALLGGLLMIAAFGAIRLSVLRAVVPETDVQDEVQRAILLACVAAAMYLGSFLCMWLVAPGNPGVGEALLTRVAKESDVGAFVCGTVLNGFLALASLSVLRACLRHVPDMASTAFRMGFACVGAGSVLRIGSQALQEARGVLIMLGRPELGAVPLDSLSLVLGGTSMLVMALGLTLPALLRHLAPLGLRHRLQLLRLVRVWRRTTAAYPEVVVHRSLTPAHGVFSGEPRAYLHRAVVELIDCEVLSGGRLFTDRERGALWQAESMLYASPVRAAG